MFVLGEKKMYLESKEKGCLSCDLSYKDESVFKRKVKSSCISRNRNKANL